MFADGSFDTLQSGLHKGGLLTLGSGLTISTENVIFLFITDAGADRFQELIISYGDRSEIPQSVIRSAARNALVDHMGNSNIVELIKKVIPYMPMEKSQIQVLFKMKIRKLPYILNVDDSAVRYLSGSSFVDYSSGRSSSSVEMVSENKSFAVLGGRAVTNGERMSLSFLSTERHFALAVCDITVVCLEESFRSTNNSHHLLNN